MADNLSEMEQRVQIKADKKEIKRRITAFMERKRKEVDELNLLEFCNLPRAEMASEFSCARVDAVLIRGAESKGHVKVSKVENQWGPQTMSTRLNQNSPASPAKSPEDQCHLPEGIEERLFNMETHLKIEPGKPVPKDIYDRLKRLEDRILFLESLSPDYFDYLPRKQLKGSSVQRRSSEKDLSLEEINVRIAMLQNNLMARSAQFRS